MGLPRLERAWRARIDPIEAPEPVASAAGRPAAGDPRRIARHRIAHGDRLRDTGRTRPIPAHITPLAEDPGDEFTAAATRNFNKAFDLEAARCRRLQWALATVVAKIAEDLGGWPVPGDAQWDVGALMARRLDRRPLLHCRRSMEKTALVMALDSSGSCLAQARFYARMAAASAALGDIELFDAPNAGLRARYQRSGWQTVPDPRWDFKRRTIVFCGDFDGGDQVVKASRTNTVYWFCSESRYPSMHLHPWCTLTLADFKGRFFVCRNENDFLHLMRTVR